MKVGGREGGWKGGDYIFVSLYSVSLFISLYDYYIIAEGTAATMKDWRTKTVGKFSLL